MNEGIGCLDSSIVFSYTTFLLFDPTQCCVFSLASKVFTLLLFGALFGYDCKNFCLFFMADKVVVLYWNGFFVFRFYHSGGIFVNLKILLSKQRNLPAFYSSSLVNLCWDTPRKIHGCSRLKAELKIQGFFFSTHYYYFSSPQLCCCPICNFRVVALRHPAAALLPKRKKQEKQDLEKLWEKRVDGVAKADKWHLHICTNAIITLQCDKWAQINFVNDWIIVSSS